MKNYKPIIPLSVTYKLIPERLPEFKLYKYLLRNKNISCKM